MKIVIIGQGRVGTFFGTILMRSHEVIFHTKEDAHLPYADFYLFATPDDALKEAAEKGSSSPHLSKSAIAIHFSGSLSSDVLKALKDHGLKVASCHPALTISEKMPVPASFFATLEGDEEALIGIKALFRPFPITFLSIKREDKLLYHTALLFAAQFILPLLSISHALLERCALEHVDSLLLNIVRGTLQNVERVGFQKSIVGPVARSDEGVIHKEEELLHRIDDHLATLYTLMTAELKKMKER